MMILAAVLYVATAALPSLAATWKDGASGYTSTDANWTEETAPATGNGLSFTNTTGRTLYVTNDISYKLGDTTVVKGAWEFASTERILSGNALLVGNASENVNIVNYADWTCAYYFAIGNQSNSTVVFTNRAGNIVCNGNSGSGMPGVTVGGRYNQENAYTGSTATFVFEGGTLTCSKAFEVGYGKNCTGVFEQTGGTITAGRLSIANTTKNSPTGATGTVLLKGGTFAAQYVAFGERSNNSGSLTFDGGTLQLTSSHSAAIQNSSKLAVKVGANGGTILLADGISSTIPANISSALSSGTDGGLTIKGTAHLTFSGTLSYSGRTSAEVGTTVIFADPSSIGGGLAITIPETPPDVGVYTVFSTTGSDTLEAAFAAATLPTGDANARFRLSADKKSIICLYGDVAQEWIGGASGSLGDASNWSTGIVPTDGNAVISSGSAATLTNSAAFTPSSITFASGSAQITIVGETTLSGLAAITNEASGVHHVFNCPVAFAANAEADIVASCGSANYVKFAGGMTAYTLKQSGAETYLAGDITITKEIDNWARNVEIDFLHLVSGATLTIPHSVTMNGESNFHIENGATLSIDGDFKTYASSGDVGFANRNNGTIDVNGLADARSHTARLIFFALNESTGVLKAKGIVSSSSSSDTARFVPNSASGNGIWVVGENGISGTGQYYIQSGRSATFHPAADYTISRSLAGNNKGTYTLSTTDYNDPTTNRTITINAAIGNGKIVVNGTGCVLFNATGGTSQGLTVNDSATVAVNAGMKPGNGAVTMNGTSTLKVAQSGTVTLGGALTVGADATLAFNFTERATAPVLSASSATISGETVNVKVSAADGIRPKGGTHTLTSGYDFTGKTVNLVDPPDWVQSVGIDVGNIVLTVKPVGFIIMFQ